MSEDDVDSMANLHAERLMRGDTSVTDAEMRIVMAGLLLSVERLSRSLAAFRDALWSEERMRKMIGEEVAKHCAANQAKCRADADAEAFKQSRWFSAAWFGRVLRGFAGLKM